MYNVLIYETSKQINNENNSYKLNIKKDICSIINIIYKTILT